MADNHSPSVRPPLGDGDPPPVELINPEGTASAVVICDHASNAVPRALDHLGLGADDLRRHIAWDIGAAALTRRLAERLDAPAVLAGYSRLVVDCNRQPGHPSSIPASSDGSLIPANLDLSEAEVEARLECIFWPYHHAVTDTLGRQWRHCGRPPALIAVHSFTPVMDGRSRPWHVGVLWNHDPRMAVPLMRRLREIPGLCVGDNEPYSGRAIGYTVDRHAGAAGLPHVALEVRQDLIADDAGVGEWGGILGEALAELLADEGLYRVEMF